MPADVEGNFYITNAKALEVETVKGEYNDFIRVRVKGADGKTALAVTLWGVLSALPEVVILQKDEREKANATTTK